MSQAFLILSIGPVQGFIAQARRAGDLYAGSQLLSRLVGVALGELEGISGCIILYPSHQEVKLESLPNKLMALIPVNQAKIIADQMEQKIKETWQELADAAKNELSRYVEMDAIWQTMWQTQINQLLEIYWTVTPWDSESYAKAYERAGRDFDARKRLRDFGWLEETGPKCTVCGERSALHRNNEKSRDYWAEVSKKVSEAKLRPGGKEGLCAVCSVKRFGQLDQLGQEHFPSVSYIAATPFKKVLLEQMKIIETNTPLYSILSRHNLRLHSLRPYISTVPETVLPALSNVEIGWGWQDIRKGFLSYDGEWLFLETYDRHLDEVGRAVPQAEAIGQAKEATEKLLQSVRDLKLNPHSPGPYYVILYADGDNMSNQMREAAEKYNDPQKHTAISQRLADFAATEARNIVEENYAGRVIYAGGDDVVALLPITEALPAANALRKAYSQKMGALLNDPTMSVGIAIVHHLSPLGPALQEARDAEKVAKRRFGKNAVAVAFRKRSGEAILVGAKWDLDSETIRETVVFLEEVRRAFVDKKLSIGVGHTLLEEAYFLDGGALPDEGKWAEVERLFTRAAGDKLSREEKKMQAKRFSEMLMKLVAGIEKISLSNLRAATENEVDKRKLNQWAKNDEPSEPPLVLAARWLILMRFLAQEGGSNE